MNTVKKTLSELIFMGRWLQVPLYFGLTVVLIVYAYLFIHQLIILVGHVNAFTDVQIMLRVLDLIDVVMIANLLIMVIVGGYETFVSRLGLGAHPDNPNWLDHVNAATMKVKLALALITISSIHLLRTFIDPNVQTDGSIRWQVIIHLTLVGSAIAIAFTNYLMEKTPNTTSHSFHS